MKMLIHKKNTFKTKILRFTWLIRDNKVRGKYKIQINISEKFITINMIENKN